MNSSADSRSNVTRINELLADAPPSDIIVFAEVFTTRGGHNDYVASAQPVPGKMTDFLSRIAVEKQSWLLVGSVMEKDKDQIYNTSVLFDRNGSIVCSYRKIHLFEAQLDENKTVREADTYSPGSKPVISDIEGWCCGLSICYDLRFSELYRHYSSKGADILFVPSDFTEKTGKAHWEILLRARAIENQCYVIAPNQCGTNTVTGIKSYGHSMIIDPWGEILCCAEDKEVVISAKLDSSVLENTRTQIPALNHRRL